jgi:hypothetical protein
VRSACRKLDGWQLASLAACVVADPLIFGPRRNLEKAVGELRSLSGIGEWTAQYIAMRASYASRTHFRRPTSVCGERCAMGTGCVHHLQHCSHALSNGDPGALMRHSTSGRPTLFPPFEERAMTSKPPERFHIDRLATPIGDALIVTNDAGILRAFDWADRQSGMQRLLRLRYGSVVLEVGAAPRTIQRLLRRYFDGEVGCLPAIKWCTGGTPLQRTV